MNNVEYQLHKSFGHFISLSV